MALWGTSHIIKPVSCIYIIHVVKRQSKYLESIEMNFMDFCYFASKYLSHVLSNSLFTEKDFFFCLTFSQTYLLHVRQKHRFGHFALPWVFLVGVNECLLCLTFGQTIFQFWSDIVRCRALFKKIVLEYSLFVYLERMEEFLALWMWKKGNCIFTILL